MNGTILRGPRALVLLLAFALVPPSAAAQQELGVDITILVPNLAPGEGLRERFGQQVARELRAGIANLHTHRTVSDRDLRAALRQYRLHERDLYRCLQARQLAVQRDWGLVVCGTYDDAGGGNVRVSASFVGSSSGDVFEVEPFTVRERDAREAAQRILQTFDTWQAQLGRTVFCSQYMDSQQWEPALDNCEQALALNPGSRLARYMSAFIYRQLDRREEALQALDLVLEADPIHQDALKLGGIVATELGQRDRARLYFDRYMELNPGDVNVRLAMAAEIANAGDPEAALRLAQQGAELNGEDVNLLTYIGHFATNAAVQAEVQQARGQERDPVEIAELYRTAAHSYDRVFRIEGDGTDPQILERLVVARFKVGEVAEAMALGRQATDLLPENALLWDAYSRALEEAGRHQDALAAIVRSRELGRTTPALVQRAALIQLRLGNTSAALASLREAVRRGEMEPHDGWRIMFRHAHQDRYRAGQLSEAYQVLEQSGFLVTAENDRLARSFWMGFFTFEQARQAQEPGTAASARRTKPMFEQALELFETSRPYERVEPTTRVAALIESTRQYIAIQDALIRRGR
jgi:tetratricopeptide (TPR) repeat protein